MKRDGGPKQVLFYFHPLPGYGVEIQIEDQKRSCFRLIKENRLSQAGPLIDIEDLVEKADHKYIIELSQDTYLENDPSKKCKNYPNKDYETYNDCDDAYFRSFFKIFYPPAFMPVWATSNMSLVTTDMDNGAFPRSTVNYEDLFDGTAL